jgi:hypothetical protein
MNTKTRNENGITHELAIALEWLTTTEKDLSNGRKVFPFTQMFDVIRREWEEQGKLRANHRKIDFALSKSHAVEYLKAGKFPLTMAHFSQPKAKADTRTMKATKINSHKGTTVYTTETYNIRVTRKTISKRAGCGLRHNTSVCSWYAVNRADPIGSTPKSGYGGLRDALAKLQHA